MKSFKSHSIALIILMILGGVLYLNTLAASFQVDDIPHITQNRSLHHLMEVGRIFRYWPTRFFLFWTLALNYRFGGLNPFGYHLVNILIHIFSAFLVYLIYFRLQRKKIDIHSFGYPHLNRLALLAGLIFLVHPLQTQAVTYIIQRGAELSGFFCLLSLYLYCRGRQDRSRFCYAGAWLVGVLGAYTKEGAVILPILLLIWELIFGPKQRIIYKIKIWAPFILLPVFLLVTMWWTVNTGDSGFYYSMNLQKSPAPLKPIDGDVAIKSRLVYFYTQLNVIRAYLRLLFIPTGQSFYHDFPVTEFIFQKMTIISAIFLSSLIVIACRMVRSQKIISFGIIFFFVALIPTSSFIILLPLIAEHHLYLSLAGFAWVFSLLLSKLYSPRNRQAIVVGGAAIILCFSLLTYQRNLVWMTPLTLWKDALGKAPHLPALHNMLATIYIEEGKHTLAVDEARKALELDPDRDRSYGNLWAAYFNLKQYDRAEVIARKWVNKFPDQPRAHRSLARTLLKLNCPQ